MNQITLQEWKTHQENKLRAFELYWKSQIQSDPENFPEKMSKGDWDEQFDFFCEEV